MGPAHDAHHLAWHHDCTARKLWRYVRALQTGRPLAILPDDIAAKTADEIENYPEQDIRHLAELKAILDEESSNYAQ